MPVQEKVLFTIIIPLYNKENQIVRTLASIEAQTFQDFEVVIVNDGSSDKSVEKIIQASHENVRIIHQENNGVSAARNNGINHARYPWIVFLDADDEMKPGYLEALYQMIKTYPDYKVFATGYAFGYSDGTIDVPKFYGTPEKGRFDVLPNYYESVIKGKNLITGSTVCIHREVFDKAGFFPVGYKLGEDLDMWFRIALHYRMVFYNSPLVIYHKDIENSATTHIDDVRNTFPYHHWFKASKNRFKLPYQKRYIINRLAKAIYIMAQHQKFHHIFRFFFR